MDPWNFIVAADIHLGSERSYRFDPTRNKNWKSARAQIRKIGPDLILIGGDMTRDGDPHEYELQMAKDDFDTFNCPYAAVAGNMEVGNKHSPNAAHREKVLECTSENLRRFCLYFGPLNWTFTHKNVRFTGFYAGVAGSGLIEEDMFWHFMDRLPTLPPAAGHVVIIHYYFDYLGLGGKNG